MAALSAVAKLAHSREEACGYPFAERPIDDYAVFDRISQMDLARSQIRIGVENLLNELYFPHVSQVMLNGNKSYTAARGATMSLYWGRTQCQHSQRHCPRKEHPQHAVSHPLRARKLIASFSERFSFAPARR
jgi:hypothetical protein